MLHSPSWWEHSPGWYFPLKVQSPGLCSSIWDGAAAVWACWRPSHSRAVNLQEQELKNATVGPCTHRVWGCAGYLAAKQALQKGITCKQGGLGHWNNFSRGTQDGLTLAISVPPWEEWFAGAVMHSDLKSRCLIWGIWVRFLFFSWRAERGKWEREHQDWKSEMMWCAPVLKMRVRICDEKMERWRRAEMLQHNEKMNSELNSG